MRMKWPLLGVLLLTVLAYHGLWTAGWVYEDSNAVQADPTTRGLAPVNWTRTRSLSALSHRLVYDVVGEQPRLHHLVNLGLHLVNGGLVFAIAGVFLTPIGALVTAALFLWHPLQTETVAYVASRSELLAATGALLAYWLALSIQSSQRANAFGAQPNWQAVHEARSLTGTQSLHAPLSLRAWGRSMAVWLSVGIALCAKESAVVIIPLVALTDVFRHRRVSGWRNLALVLSAIAIAISVFEFDYLAQSELGRLDYAATQATAVWRYLALALVPIGQTVDHDFDVVPWVWRYCALGGLWVLALIPLFGAWTWADEQHRIGRLWDDVPQLRLIAFGLTWLLIGLAPRFVMRTTEFLAEHHTLLPFIGVWFIMGVFAEKILEPFVSVAHGSSLSVCQSRGATRFSQGASLCRGEYSIRVVQALSRVYKEGYSRSFAMARQKIQHAVSVACIVNIGVLSTDFRQRRLCASSDGFPCGISRLGKSLKAICRVLFRQHDEQLLGLAADARVLVQREPDVGNFAAGRFADSV